MSVYLKNCSDCGANKEKYMGRLCAPCTYPTNNHTNYYTKDKPYQPYHYCLVCRNPCVPRLCKSELGSYNHLCDKCKPELINNLEKSYNE